MSVRTRCWVGVLTVGIVASGAGPGPAFALELREGEDPGGYSYQPGGRRDPFLKGGAAAPRPLPCAARDLGGVPIQDVALRGVVWFGEGPVALLKGPDARTHFARTGDRLCDGRVSAIGPDRIRFERDTSDSVGPSTREVVQLLHP
jgi:hypothetical protein